MSIARIPRMLQRTMGGMTWHMDGREREVFLTFDDGPTPGVTSWVLDRLDEYGAKATFFCLGRNAEAHRELYQETLRRGHSVGNHTYSHLRGFSTSTTSYLDDVHLAASFIESTLFRPPYGRILPRQVREVRKNFRIIMWEVLSVDYNRKLPGKHVAGNVTRNVRPGSIVVFHDSVKASKNLYHALPVVLDHLQKEGYRMRAIQ